MRYVDGLPYDIIMACYSAQMQKMEGQEQHLRRKKAYQEAEKCAEISKLLKAQFNAVCEMKMDVFLTEDANSD